MSVLVAKRHCLRNHFLGCIEAMGDAPNAVSELLGLNAAGIVSCELFIALLIVNQTLHFEQFNIFYYITDS